MPTLLPDAPGALSVQNRRAFLARLLPLGALVVLGPGISACRGETTPPPQPGSASTLPQTGPVASECAGYETLTPRDLNVRQTLQYVDVSSYPEKQCQNCQLYKAPHSGSPCGGCTLFRGPVAPTGYCVSWVQQPGA